MKLRKQLSKRLTEALLEPNTYSVDTALDHVGGFGRFQLAMTFALMVAQATGKYITYGFGILTLNQTYNCFVNGQE
jgi:hypothetical protein